MIYSHVYHGETFKDSYQWLRDDSRQNKDVLSYLDCENDYTRQNLVEPLKELKNTLYKEFVSRMQEDDQDVPVLKDNFLYFKKVEKGKQYQIYCRRLVDSNEERVLLDLNDEEFKKHSFLNVGSYTVSVDHKKIIAYSLDTFGGESYKVRIRDTTTNEEKEIADNSYYSLTCYKIMMQNIKTGEKCVVYEETDPKFSVGLSKSDDKKYIFLHSQSSLTREVRIIDANDPIKGNIEKLIAEDVMCFRQREMNHRYYIQSSPIGFLVLSNKENKENFQLYLAPNANSSWIELLPYDKDVYLEDFRIFKDYLLLFERSSATVKVRVIPFLFESSQLDIANSYYIEMEDEIYSVSDHKEQQFENNIFRFSYSSLIQPEKVIDFNLKTREKIIKKERIVNGFSKSDYCVKRLNAKGHDDVNIPLSLVYKKALFKGDGTNLCLLYGYGSYGICIDPSFRSNWISYLDRGFVCVIAHIRGGGDCGRSWYNNGKFLSKKNTFKDFISSAEFLLDNKFTSPTKLAIEGRSAGGLLIGAVLNERPELFTAAVAGVPFVDVINTMMDESIPLTINEYEEWGNPNDKTFFDYMLSYSPYNNIPDDENIVFPNLLVTAGLHDPRVQYWEPTKYVAKLMESKIKKKVKTGVNSILGALS
ncbi:hypothetical protein ROZALSC1DRAFT_29766 [Rozella allomycis CSF55]|uniref:Prolyl endopeptidase n=1 Tax=Rozella allomycis (strain CSF55) TaxID=988480 RepID=A0A4P9YJH8_ROZAC|nr:hypothetical protein ROZALSC1DRAFT_29766 [Rozella allomycis CSF55]